MENRFKEKLTRESEAMLEKMRAELWSNPKEGLAFHFGELADAARECHKDALRKIVIGAPK